MPGGIRAVTRREALRFGGVALAVMGTSVVGCDTRSSGTGGRGVSKGVATTGGSVRAFPVPGTPTASTRTTISFRGVDSGTVGTVTVLGSRTGEHTGKLRGHPDGGGATFIPDVPFEAGETVTVRTDMDLRGADKGNFDVRIARPFKPPDSGNGGGQSAPSDAPGKASDPPAVQTFSSRQDLRPPKLEVVQSAAENMSPGYVVLGSKKPLENTTQEGPLILDNRGEVVWFHPLDRGTEAMDVKVQRFRGGTVLTWWEGVVGPGYGSGEYVIVDQRYKEIARIAAGNGYAGDLHEFVITPEGTALFTIYNAVRWNESGNEQGSSRPVLDNVVQEVDIDSGDVLFEWHSLGQVSLDESYGDVIKDPADVFDYLHHNSIDVDGDGHFLVSGRHTRTVYKIDRATGAIRWRLGGKKSDFAMGRGTTFAYQHDVQRRADGTLTIFDNAAGSKESAVRDASRGLVLELDEKAMKASLIAEYEPPESILSDSQGNMQLLPNGNVFIGWGSAPAFTEYGKDGAVLFDVRFPPEVESYRAFRFPWKGRPTDKPAVAVESAYGDSVTVAASWNGATEVATWQVLAGPSGDQLEPVGQRKREGFETRITVPTEAARVAVQALDAEGNALGTSPSIAAGR